MKCRNKRRIQGSRYKALKIQTAEPQNKKPQNIEVKNIVLFLSITSAVRHSLFDIVLRTPHPAGGSPVSIFKKQKKLNPPSSRTECCARYNFRQSLAALYCPRRPGFPGLNKKPGLAPGLYGNAQRSHFHCLELIII
jgi:hypothetical protein